MSSKPQEIVVEQAPAALTGAIGTTPSGGTAVATQAAGSTGAVAIATEIDSFIQMIERASRDPSVDIDKMERLLQMRDRMVARNAEVAFNAALARMQVDLPEIPERGAIKNKNGGVQSRYALWEDLNKIIKPVLTRHGFALTFRTGNEGVKMVVTGILSHEQGHSVSSTMHLPLDTSGAKNDVQGLGSSTSYGKRYVAAALLNLTSRGEDDDGAGGARVTAMGADVKQEYEDAIAATKNRKEAESLWTTIAAACTKLGDVETYSEMHKAVGAKIKSFATPAAAAKDDGGII